MSLRVMHWALNQAPVKEPVKVLILVAMAERANDDGTDVWQAVGTIAEKARVSVRTVQREMKELEAAGLITRGDQSRVAHLPANRRPVVWDIVMYPRGDKLAPQNEIGVTDETPRGDNGDTLGVTLLADNKSLDKSLKSPIGNVDTLPGIPGPSRAKKTKHPLPSDWAPNATHRQKALSAGLDLDANVSRFRYHHEANGTLFVNWDAAFHMWLGRGIEFKQSAAADTPKPTAGAYAKFVPPTMEDMLAEEAELRRKYGDGS